MANSIYQAIGRVQPIFKGTWGLGPENGFYKKLDNVLYEGCTYVALRDIPADVTTYNPAMLSDYWQLVARKGDTGGIASVIATAFDSADAYVSAWVTGDDPTNMSFGFNFGLPSGPAGPAAAVASAVAFMSQLPSTASPSVDVRYNGPDTAASLSFYFGIPAVAGGVATVDDQGPTGGNVELEAVRYVEKVWPAGTSAEAIASKQAIARANIKAQVEGDYIADPSDAPVNSFLYKNNDDEWVGTTIITVPAGSTTDVGYYLRRNSSGNPYWADLVIETISNAEINTIIGS